MKSELSPPPHGVLVSDFDGTMTHYDFYQLVLESLLPPDTPNYWIDYRAGIITHFEALQRYFAAIRANESDVLAVVERMELDPALPDSLARLRDAGWDVIVASAGCDWYIRHLLDRAGVDVEVHANPGQFVPGRGLWMTLPAHSPFLSPTHGIDKAGIVRHYLNLGRIVAFAGDGFPDVNSAKLVPAEYRFARADCASELTREGMAFHPFERWSDVASGLVAEQAQ